MQEKNSKINNKLVLIFALPLFIFMISTAINIKSEYDELQTSRGMYRSNQVLNELSDFLEVLSQEFILSSNPKDLSEQRKRTDKEFNDIIEILKKNKNYELDTQKISALLSSMRESINKNESRLISVKIYQEIYNKILDIEMDIANSKTTKGIGKIFGTIGILDTAKVKISEFHNLAFNLLNNKNNPEEVKENIKEIMVARGGVDINLQSNALVVSEQSKKRLKELPNGPYWKDNNAVLVALTMNRAEDKLKIDKEKFLNQIIEQKNDIFNITKNEKSVLNKKIDGVIKEIENIIKTSVLVTTALIFIVMIFFFYQFRSIVLPVKKLAENVSNLLNNMRQSVFTVDRQGTILGPVSHYSEKVFKKEIEGKNIFDIVYKDLDKKSEEYDSFIFAFEGIYGEDDIQWALLESHLIKKVPLKNDTNGETKWLKIDYRPMWSPELRLDRVMLVIEDITDILKLEEEVNINNRKIQILQQLAANSLNDVSAFFKNASELMKETERLLRSDSIDIEKSNAVMRNLHTLKGNARGLGLELISAVTHRIENEIINLNSRLKIKEISADNYMTFVKAEISKVQQLIVEYTTIASNIFKIENNDDNKYIPVLEKYFTEMESVLMEILKLPNPVPGKNELKFLMKKMRQIPLSKELPKLHALVDDIAKKFSKKVELVMEGDEILLDEKNLNLISDSLVHILRNSLDHGLETPEIRRQMNKNEKGLIKIKGKQEGDFNFQISISDDGQGIDPTLVATRALEKKIITEAQFKKMSEEEILKLIFLPSFSTKTEANEYSGRGIGMDVVKSNVEKMGGHVVVETHLGKGTEFRIIVHSNLA